ncbi:GD16406 [Drosophila simulans]|uniref:GD16406 n=1 Tax=Drosophila simulans TaxID=7240 RepID=B4R320_DROSI|nr:GD16406 [Drosophila simulans]
MLQLQHQQQIQQQQQLQVTSGGGLAPPTGSIVTITTTNPSQTYAMVQDSATVGAAAHSEDDAPAPRKITAYSENLQKILNKSKSQESTGGPEEFTNINSVVIKPIDKNTLNCPPSFNILRQQQHSQAAQSQSISAVGSGSGTPVTFTMASGNASDLATTSTVSVSAGTICINSPMMGTRPIISIQNKNISLVLSKTTMAQQKPKMITTTTLASQAALQMHHALIQDSSADKAGSSATSGSATSGASMQLKLTTANTPTKLSVSLAPDVVKLEEVGSESKAKLLVKQEAVVKDSIGTPSSEQERAEEIGTPESV